MDECLGNVPSQLALLDIELLGHETGRPARASISLEKPARPEVVTLLVLGERQEEPTQQKSALGLAKWPAIGTKAIHVLLFDEFGFDSSNRRDATGIGHRQRAANSGKQQ